MTSEQAKDIFNQAIAATTNADQIAKIELVREYFTNRAFRKALENHIWNINNP